VPLEIAWRGVSSVTQVAHLYTIPR